MAKIGAVIQAFVAGLPISRGGATYQRGQNPPLLLNDANMDATDWFIVEPAYDPCPTPAGYQECPAKQATQHVKGLDGVVRHFKPL